MGRRWMKGLGIELHNVKEVKVIPSVEGLVAEYASVFADALATFQRVSAKIAIRDNPKPRFFKARPAPFAVIDHVNEELIDHVNKLECCVELRLRNGLRLS
ncbi:hypothetical protein MTO96_016201 [Rhipicephalus appendiculatus]